MLHCTLSRPTDPLARGRSPGDPPVVRTFLILALFACGCDETRNAPAPSPCGSELLDQIHCGSCDVVCPAATTCVAAQSTPEEPPHPWQIPTAPTGQGRGRRKLLQGYYAAVTAMDAGIGRIVDKLEAMGARENTLIFFTSDNGMNMGHHGVWGKGNGTFPQNMYDTSVKVPAIFSRPGHVPQGRTCRAMVSQYDFMPTLLDYLGLENPEAPSLPGTSFAPLLRGRRMRERESVVVFDEYGPVRMIRTRQWKYVHRYPYGPHELYDLANDPGERENLFGVHRHRGRVKGLKAELEAWFHRFADPAVDGTHEAVFGSGQLGLAGPAGKGAKAFADLEQLEAKVKKRTGA